MAKQAVAKKTEGGRQLIAGCIEPNSTVANLYAALKDGKAHSLESLKSCLTSKKINLRRRVRNLGMKGLASKQWVIEVTDGEKVRLIAGKPPAGSILPRFRAAAKEEKPAAKAKGKKTKGGKPAAKQTGGKKPGASVQDVPVSED